MLAPKKACQKDTFPIRHLTTIYILLTVTQVKEPLNGCVCVCVTVTQVQLRITTNPDILASLIHLFCFS